MFGNRGNEVLKVMAIDMTFEAREKIFRREEHEDGVKEGIEIGIAQGIEQGIAQGLEQGITQSIENSVSMLKELNHSKEEAIASLNKSHPGYSDFITEMVDKVYK